MKFKSLPVILGYCLFVLASTAQPESIFKGKVTGEKTGEPLIGVNINIDSKFGTTTNNKGKYFLKLPAGRYSITYSYLGYNNFVLDEVIIPAKKTTVKNIALKEASSLIDEVIVSTSKYGKKLAKQSVSVELLKAQQLISIAAKDASDAIKLSPGAYIIDGQVNIRGGTGFSYGAGSRVQMVIDDLPLLSADRGDIRWNLLPLETIERIEIIKGASSVLYGSAALNGVVHARTIWPGNKPKGNVTAWSGTYQLPKNYAANDTSNTVWWNNTAPIFSGSRAYFSTKLGKQKKLDLVIGAAAIFNRSYLEDEKQDYVRGNLKLRYRPSENLSFGASINANQVEEGLFILWNGAGSLSSLENASDYNKYLQIYIDPFVTYFDPFGIKHKLRGRIYNLQSFYDIKQPRDGTANIITVDYNAFKNVGPLDLTVGLSYNHLFVKDNALVNANGWLLAPYLQAEYKPFSRLELAGGLRWESFQLDNIKGASLPVFKGGLNYQLAKKTYLRGSFGQGFRFPSLAERYVDYKIGAINYLPNKNLEPETGWNAEAGIKQEIVLNDWKTCLDAAFYVTEYSNMIEAVFDFHKPDSINFSSTNTPEVLYGRYLGWQFQNISEGRIAGLEYTITSKGKLAKMPLTILAGYTFALPVDLTANPRLSDWGKYFKRVLNSFDTADTLLANDFLKYRFQHIAKFDVLWEYNQFKFGDFHLGITGNYFSNMGNIDDVFLGKSDWTTIIQLATGSPYPVPGVVEYRAAHSKGDFILDARIGFNPIKKVAITFLAKNIANRSYTIRPAKLEAPANYTLQLKVDF